MEDMTEKQGAARPGTAMQPPTVARPGTAFKGSLEAYEMVRQLGSGAFAVVYLARRKVGADPEARNSCATILRPTLGSL